jgi:hypothetical protein
MTAYPQTWTHTEPKVGALAETILQGYKRAESGDWQSGTDAERTRAWYGLWIETAYCMAELAGRVEKGQTIKIDPGVSPEASPDRRRAAVILYQSAFLLMVEHERSGALETTIADDSKPTDTGVAPLVAAALLAAGVVVAVAQAAAVAYVATKGLELVNQELARRDDLRMLVKTHGAVLQIVREHVTRESELGKQIPLDPAERAAIDGLSATQKAIAQKQAQPLAPELERVGSAMASATRWLPWILGGALALYLWTTKAKDPQQ